MSPRFLLPFSFLVLISAGCMGPGGRQRIHGEAGAAGQSELLFHTRFEKDTALVTDNTGHDRFTGTDHSLARNSGWDTLEQESGGKLRGGGVLYSTGERLHREATVVKDPTDLGNSVVRFRGIGSPESQKFRIQVDFSSPGHAALKEFTCSVKLYVPETLSALRDYPKAINWLTIAEFWNDPAWTSDEETEHAFRVTVGIGKDAGTGQDLYFRISTDDFSYTGTGANRKYKQIHIEVIRATHFIIPFDQWMTLHYYFRDGGYNASDGTPGGHFSMAVVPEGEESQEICSIDSTMHSPANLAPKGVTYWNPMKMYTSRTLAAWMQSQGKELELFFDDLAIWNGPVPGLPN
ncbi:MAG: hypothetical protein U1E27_03975 [Kiritimatiellia bacterium]|nr:hypothetical protein [Kiritimatiellia bacterium]